MPHVRLEYSPNILEKEKLAEVFPRLHQLLAAGLPTEILSCKSRAVACPIYYLGDGQAPNAFIHVEIKVKSGRSAEVLQRVGAEVQALLVQHFAASFETLELELTLEITEISNFYFKQSHVSQ